MRDGWDESAVQDHLRSDLNLADSVLANLYRAQLELHNLARANDSVRKHREWGECRLAISRATQELWTLDLPSYSRSQPQSSGSQSSVRDRS